MKGEADAARAVSGSSRPDAPDFGRPAKRIGLLRQGRRDFAGFRIAATVESVK